MSNSTKLTAFKPTTGELRKDLLIFSEKNKNKTWLIFDPVTDKYFRITHTEYIIISNLKFNCYVSEFTKNIQKTYNSIAEEKIQTTLLFLRINALIHIPYNHLEPKIKVNNNNKYKNLLNKIFFSYLSFKIRLWNPDDFLNSTSNIIKRVFNKWTLSILSLIAICGYLWAFIFWNKFETTFIDSLNYSNLIKYGLTVIFIKILHEFSHAYTAKLAGSRIRWFGIGFIVFFPRFFTDITDSWRIHQKSKRILIDSAGIIIEIIIGGISAIVWLNSNPGVINITAYYIFAVTIINTILINGNPLIRYDGYYLLMDIVNIDNLQYHSNLEIKLLARKMFWGIIETPLQPQNGWKKIFCIVYGISAFIYRLFLYTSIILIIYIKFVKIIGIILICLELYILIIKPLSIEIKTIMKKKIKIRNTFLSFIVLLILSIILFSPLPWTVRIPCIVSSNKSQIIYIKHDGFLKNFYVRNYEKVKKGEKIFTETNPHLTFENNSLKIQLDINKTELDQMESNIAHHASKQAKIQKIVNTENDLKENKRRINLLEYKAPKSGTFILFGEELPTGKWLNKGEVIGEIYSSDEFEILAFAQEKYIKQLKIGSEVKINLNNDIRTFSGVIQKINSVPTKTCHPSPLLSVSGGPIEVLRRKNNYTYLLRNYYYLISIRANINSKDFIYSRTGTIQTYQYYSIGINFIRSIIVLFEREMTF